MWGQSGSQTLPVGDKERAIENIFKFGIGKNIEKFWISLRKF